MKTLRIAALLFLLPVGQLWAQSAKWQITRIPVTQNGVALRMPWTGGMNAPQFSPCDLNRDGLTDLFVFDRVGSKVLTFINRGGMGDTAFTYAPSYEKLFPKELSQWALIRDYNYDNIPDIFAHANGGIVVFKGSVQNNQLHFDSVSPLLLYNYNNQYDVNIWVNIDDIPVFADVNGDGDMDILTYGIFGAAVEYYENQTKEHLGNPDYDVDSLKFSDATMCWGNFAESASGNGIVLHATCKGGGRSGTPQGGPRHTGSTLYHFDADNDGDVDLLIGDVSYPNLVYVQNCGDSSYANICYWDSTFPSCNVPVSLPVFPAAYGFDVNRDGLEDLLIAPNARTDAQDTHNVLYYQNSGNPSCPFILADDSFLTRHTLDFGTDSKPVFFDFDGDGLQDIVVGNYGYFQADQSYQSALAVYRNTGTSTNPHFELLSSDYHSFSSFGLNAMHPAFGDLDGDGRADLLIGDNNGQLHFFKNTGGTAADFPSMTIPNYFALDIGDFAAPFIYDLNGDSLNDILVGRKDGKISYFRNFGSKTNPQFSMDSVNPFFGEINISQYGYNDGYSCPYVAKDSSGQMLLYTGTNRGTIFVYQIDTNRLNGGSFLLIDSDFLHQSVGAKSTFSMTDLNDDGKSEYLIGNARGGLLLYSDTLWASETDPLALHRVPPKINTLFLYPNPAKDLVYCHLADDVLPSAKVMLYTFMGQAVNANSSISAHRLQLNTAELPDGLYLLQVISEEKTYWGKIIIAH